VKPHRSLAGVILRAKQRGQATAELGLLIPAITGLIALALQAGLVISDQVNLEHYAQEGALWAVHNGGTATSSGITNHIYAQMCGGAKSAPSATGSKFCQTSALTVSVSTVTTPSAMEPAAGLGSSPAPGATSQVLANTSCKSWSLTVSPTSQTVTQGQTAQYTVQLSVGGGGNTAPSVTLSISGYPNGLSPGYPTFNPPSISSTSPTSTISMTTSGSTTPEQWTMQVGGRDQCGAASSGGLVGVTLTVSGTSTAAPCSTPPTVLVPAPNTVQAGTATQLTIPGTGFKTGATVNVGGSVLSAVTVNSASQITATTLTSIAAGVYNVTVTNPDGCSGTLNNALTVSSVSGPSPTPTSIVPSYNACASGGGSFESKIIITWSEPLFIPWLTGAMRLTATQFAFCQ